MRRLLALTIIVVLAACSDAATESASQSGRIVPSVEPSPTRPIPSDSGQALATLTLVNGAVADGPGKSVSAAIASAGDEPQLVNGILLKDTEGTVWLCDLLLESSPPQCAPPRLLVENYPEDHVVIDGQDFYSAFARDQPEPPQEADGVRWVVGQQLLGVVRSSPA
jgi:hypothetical protein